jgi:hypothetical protein
MAQLGSYWMEFHEILYDYVSKIRRENCEKRLSALSYPSVRPSVRMDQLGSYWTDFHEILYLIMFRKSVEKFAKSDYQLCRIRQSVRPSAWINSAPTGWNFTKFYI